ncbi:helix-turn-helix domain-containing protein [Nocardia sp. NPDC056100]|uniref:helix-turn-helix domain-containing protein n=1 Tax=Nocardia sp. NPDC056100 TaxID=3345712 RepID=UPI0035D53A52
MGRRKRSRLNTQAFLASGGVSKKQQEAAERAMRGESAAAVSAESAAPAAKAAAPQPAAAKPATDAAAKPAPAAAEPVAQPGDGPDINALADRVKARRKEMGWTQGDVAKKGGPAAGMISQIERSLVESPAADVLSKLDAGLEWPANTAEAILAGRVPVGA